MSTKANNQPRQAGASACMKALRNLDQAATLGCGYVEGDTDQSYFEERRAHVQEFISALGPLDARVEGVIATMAEYIHASIQAGQPNLAPGKWMPMAAKAGK